MNRFALWTLALAILTGSSLAHAGDKKPAKDIFKVEGKLTDDDKQKVHTVKLEAGKFLRIDLTSGDFDTFLRLKDEKDKTLAENDDVVPGRNLNSQIIYKITKSGEYKLIVSSFDRNFGTYNLSVVEASLTDQAGLLTKMDKEARSNFLGDLSKYLQQNGSELKPEDLNTIFVAFIGLERKDAKQAIKAYDDTSVILAKSSDKQIVRLADMMAGCSRRLQLVGQEMEIKGTKLDGKPIDWKSYRGKVVLVDFWATWCPPCLAEIPNMKKNLELYKDRGFEIVGISIDQNRDALENFMEKQKLPWVCIHETIARGGQPLAKYFGVVSIPLAILVDRDGKVISLHARGAELDRLLEKHIGAEKKGEK